MKKALGVIYVGAVAALVAAAVGILRLRCEGFGCMGIGVAWFAWAISFFVVFVLGLLARSKAASIAGLGTVVKGTWWLQVGLGAIAVAVWLHKSAA
ncbi:MAG TPA: hypothetical protein PLX20_08280 [Rhodocyclaceae bacterium]|nr:hypothetical protein [Rhodocyclaceae bacterium]HMV55020.1 hypothetical protein [Rhodocyclaceae bacterium]HNC61896.1 hypothetical protein [Rhodocyclaceae bacterium]HNH13114.1 hypothetical protein [Rhodocyclaceae bacterium]